MCLMSRNLQWIYYKMDYGGIMVIERILMKTKVPYC